MVFFCFVNACKYIKPSSMPHYIQCPNFLVLIYTALSQIHLCNHQLQAILLCQLDLVIFYVNFTCVLLKLTQGVLKTSVPLRESKTSLDSSCLILLSILSICSTNSKYAFMLNSIHPLISYVHTYSSMHSCSPIFGCSSFRQINDPVKMSRPICDGLHTFF